jgi:hypothetical protein
MMMMIESKYGSMGVWEYENVFLTVHHILSGTRIPRRCMEE